VGTFLYDQADQLVAAGDHDPAGVELPGSRGRTWSASRALSSTTNTFGRPASCDTTLPGHPG
jgi:hypothetical protein